LRGLAVIGPESIVAIAWALLAAAAAGAAVAAILLRRQRALTAALRHARGRIAEMEGDGSPESFGTLVSHDLRAPIRVVEGFTRIVKEDYASVLDRIGVDHLDRVLGAATRMNHMIDALLALSKLSSQPIAHVPVDLSQLAGYIVADLRRLAPEQEVAVEIEPGLTTVGDPTLLRMVLENLLGNAWKYTGNARAPRVAFTSHADEPSTFTVRDNGAGFDMRFADRLFGAFQRLHSASEFPGTGVGLASVRRIVRRHGGEVRAEGAPDRGASFHFSLPPGPG
jgi:signal transduction histidine kinase